MILKEGKNGSTKNGDQKQGLRQSHETNDETHEEFADVEFENGYVRPVCVTADSPLAIVCDVIRSMF